MGRRRRSLLSKTQYRRLNGFYWLSISDCVHSLQFTTGNQRVKMTGDVLRMIDEFGEAILWLETLEKKPC